MVVDGDVPRAYDKIQILFTLDDTETDFWWPGVVISSRETPNSENVKGVGIIEYAARHRNKVEQEEVIFLANRTVTTSLGDTPWRTATEAADLGGGDDDDKSWEVAEDSRTVREKRRASSVSEGVQRDGVEQVRNPREANQGERQKRRKRDNRKGAVVRRAKRGTQPQLGVRENDDGGGKEEVAALRLQMQGVRTILAGAVANSAENEVVNKIGEKKMIWKVQLQKLLASALKENKCNRARPFSAVVQTSTIVYRDIVSYETFAQIVRALVQDTERRESRDEVDFVPSLEDVLDPQLNMGEASVLFSSARAMLRWLGIGSPEDVKGSVVREQKLRSGLQVLRVLGGLRWNGQSEGGMHVFIGFSCGGDGDCVDETATTEKRKAVGFATARYDNSNNSMAAPPTLTEAHVGRYTGLSSYSRARDSVFSMSWKWMRGLEGKAFSECAKSTGSYRLGHITLTIPYVMFRGAETCNSVRELLR